MGIGVHGREPAANGGEGLRCILHIGTPKTGSTQLQRWLYANEGALSAAGVALAHAFREPNNRLLPTMFVAEPDPVSRRMGIVTPDRRRRFGERLTAAFDAELATARGTHHTMILTSEHLYRDLTEPESIGALARWLRARFGTVLVVCYVREQGALRRSRYSNVLRGDGSHAIDDPGFTGRIEAAHDYAARLAPWEDAFGPDALRPRIYDRQTLVEGDIRHDFRTAVLDGVDAGALAYGHETVKPALTAAQGALARMVNRAIPALASGAQNPTHRRLKVRLLALPFLREGAPFANRGAREMHARMDAANRRFSERYLGRAENPFRVPEEDGDARAPATYTHERVEEIVGAICGTSGLVVLDALETDRLDALARRLAAEGVVTARESALLLGIVERCRPHSRDIAERMNALRAASFEEDG